MREKKLTYLDTKIVSDPDGSYTGNPTDDEEKPVQDADDL